MSEGGVVGIEMGEAVGVYGEAIEGEFRFVVEEEVSEKFTYEWAEFEAMAGEACTQDYIGGAGEAVENEVFVGGHRVHTNVRFPYCTDELFPFYVTIPAKDMPGYRKRYKGLSIYSDILNGPMLGLDSAESK